MSRAVGKPALSGRLDRLDALRALAMLWMTAYHLAFDLNHFGLLHANFYTDPFWTWQRTAIVSLFLFTAGMSQAAALHHHPVGASVWDARFARRWAQVAGCALLVSAGSAVVFPNSWIYFGVLHGLAVMLLVARLTVHWGRWLWLVGGLAIVAKWIAWYAMPSSDSLHFFNENWLNWLGLIGQKPRTEDYVPLLPWLAAVWWGLAAGRWVLHHRPHWLSGSAQHTRTSPQPATQALRLGSGQGAVSVLAALGRWSLSYYMLHQLVLMGLVWAWVRWLG